MQKKVAVESTTVIIGPLKDWKAFCSKSGLNTFLITMYNTEDCRTSLRYFDIKPGEDPKSLQLAIESFISFCIRSSKKAVASKKSTKAK
jgi:uncharacterized protein with ACT and thioredoxin-like domain